MTERSRQEAIKRDTRAYGITGAKYFGYLLLLATAVGLVEAAL